MKIHKEGYNIILTSFIIIGAVVLCFYLFSGWQASTKTAAIAGTFFFLFIIRFFRSPKRICVIDDDLVIAPADGKIVIIQEVEENEFLKAKAIQVSVFMSIFNVHVNWYPVGGKILYSKHHHGNYLVAWHPKSSEKNERTSIGMECVNGRIILFRQIAGYIARRIVCYAKKGEHANQCSQVGFIKFGSRIDMLLPTDSEILVKPGDKVRGCETIIAKLAK